MKKKKTITLTLIGLFIFLLSIIGLTYAYWQITRTQTDENLVYTDCLRLTTSLTSNGAFTLTDAYPMTNKELVSDFFPNQTPYHFTITNECESDIPISINMESLTPTNTPALKDAYVDIILWEGDSEDKMQQGETQVLSKVGSRVEIGSDEAKPSYKLTDHKTNQDKIITDANTAYQIYKFILPGKKADSTDNIKDFDLLLFMDYDTPVDGTIVNGEAVQTNNAYWAGKITLNNYEIPTLIDEIKALPIQEEDSGESGLYLVKHTGIENAWEGLPEQLASFQLPEYRYAGKDPNNYISFGESYENDTYLFKVSDQVPLNEYDSEESCIESNVDKKGHCELYHHAGEPIYWRIIGLVNTPEGQRVKLIRENEIGDFSWDSSKSSVNNGGGVNEWSQSDLMKLLNEGFDQNKLEDASGEEKPDQYVNNSLYWKSESGKCYNGQNNLTEDCNFTHNNMFPNDLKNMIDEITWNTGSDGIIDKPNDLNAEFYYSMERSSYGKTCSGGSTCNDEVDREISWKGKVGLIYPSDYGYASVGEKGKNTREYCLNLDFSSWGLSCYENDWLYSKHGYWTLSPHADMNYADYVFQIIGNMYNLETWYEQAVRPSVYLSTNVVVLSGDGSKNDAYILSGN